MLLVVCVIIATLIFTYTNGLNDTANSIATVVATKVLTPQQAVLMATFCNLLGAMAGNEVAKTMGTGLVDVQCVTLVTLLGAVMAAFTWNLITWYFALPSSSSHALIGGLCGAAIASAHGSWSVLVWSSVDSVTLKHDGLLHKVIIPMVTSPVLGLIIGFAVMKVTYAILWEWSPGRVHRVFGKLQILSASYMGFGHGFNDAQKTMGIIVLALITASKSGYFDHLPPGLKFLCLTSFTIPLWVQVLCGATMAAGTAAGGWRIIRTLGHKMVRLQPVHGFAAETTAASILTVAAAFGMPVSTTHAITTSIMGVGVAKRFSALKLGLVERIIWAWVLTLPAAGLLGYLLVSLGQSVGIK